MKDFLSYEENKGKTDDKTLKTFYEFAEKYEGKSAEEMMSYILAEAEKGRKNGTLTNSDIDNFYNTVTPMLDKSQVKMLEKIIKRLKT